MSEITADDVAKILKSSSVDMDALSRAIQEELGMTTAEALAMLVRASVKTGDAKYLKPTAYLKSKYLYEPIAPARWIVDKSYFGHVGESMFGPVKEDFLRIFTTNPRPLRVILSGSIGWGKCVSGETELLTKEFGIVKVKDAVDKTLTVQTEKDGKVFWSLATAAESGIKESRRLLLTGGREIILSDDHPVRVRDGFKRADALLPGELVACLNEFSSDVRCYVKEEEAILLGYLLGDGGCTTSTTTFTNADVNILNEFCAVAEKIGGKKAHKAKCQGSGKAAVILAPGLLGFRNKYNINGAATTKRVPRDIFFSSPEIISLFINRLFACDASVYSGRPPKIGITLANSGLIDDIRFLLLRLGIKARKRYRVAKCLGKSFDAWRLQITNSGEIKKFLSVIGPILGKEKKCDEILRRCLSHNPNVDIVPVTIKDIKDYAGRGKYNRPPHQHFSRSLFSKFISEFPDHKYAWTASPNICWEKVKTIERIGPIPVYDLCVPETGSWIGNGIIIHNSFLSEVIMSRLLYELGCLRAPQVYYGLAQTSWVTFMNLGATASNAKRVFFAQMREMVDMSPWFREKFKRNMEIQTSLVWPARRISFVPGSSSELAPLGENLFGGVIDEANFFQVSKTSKKIRSSGEQEYDQAKRLHDGMWRRMKSRFNRLGRFPGMLVINSSAKYPEDFVEKIIRENDPTTMVLSHSEWETKPATRYSGKKIYVFVGDANRSPRMLKNEAEGKDFEKLGKVVAVPEEYESDFNRDLEGSIRDIIGLNIRSQNRFFSNVDAVLRAFTCTEIPIPFGLEQMNGILGDRLKDSINYKKFLIKDSKGQPIIKMHPNAPRFAHIDLGISQDSTGFCICHIGEFIDVDRRREDGNGLVITKESVPVIYVDIAVRILPPPGGEVVIEDVRNLVYDFRDKVGFHFAKITYDQFQSKESMQTLQRRFGPDIVAHQSVVRTADAYLGLKEAVYENRLKCYAYPPLLRELKDLIRDPATGKIDHPPHSSKDISDALAGAVWNAILSTDFAISDRHVRATPSDTISLEEQMAKDAEYWLLGLDGKKKENPLDDSVLEREMAITDEDLRVTDRDIFNKTATNEPDIFKQTQGEVDDESF